MTRMALLQDLIVEVRALRKEIGVEEKAHSSAYRGRRASTTRISNVVEENRDIIQRLAR